LKWLDSLIRPWKTLPEIRHMPQSISLEIYIAAGHRALQKSKVFRLLVGGFAILAGAFMFWSVGKRDWAWLAVLVGVLLPVVMVTYLYWHHRLCRLEMADILYERGLRPRGCLRCGYDLRGISSDTCPECGAPLAAVGAGGEGATGGDTIPAEESRLP